jgi:glycosyltransferase involved in cell wall biosynthesis
MPNSDAAKPAVSRALSVVVAVHDVEPWVAECLDSVARCVPDGTEVVVVDDGSTDGSSGICDDMARGRAGWLVVHQVNAGLGAARNVGLDLATGDYVGFVDGDDTLLPAYARMLEAARRGDMDMATGAVLRTDGTRSWVSGLHRMALRPLGDVATMTRNPSMIYDTTAWNKIYRRSFLKNHGLRFPEGVLYEDLPFTIPALYFAAEVACVHDPVYAWRTRQHGLSITQRRNEIRNLQDRFAAIWAVNEFLEAEGQHALRVAHDDKVLRLDLPLYTSALPEADDDYRTAYMTSFRRLVADLPQERRRALPPTLRLYLELADAGRMDDLVQTAIARRGERAWARTRRSRWERLRQSLAVFRLERQLGLVTRRQLVRRGVASAARILLPSACRRAVGAARERITGARSHETLSRGVRSGAGSSTHAADRFPEDTQREITQRETTQRETTQRQGKDE